MRLPYLQVTQETWTKAGMLSGLLGMTSREARGLIVDLWRWGVELGPDDTAPTGVCGSPRAARMLAGALQWGGKADDLVNALADVGLIEPRVDGSIRVRGMDRYRRTWEKNHRRTSGGEPAQPVPGTGAQPAPDRQESGATTAPQTQTQTQNQEKEPTNLVEVVEEPYSELDIGGTPVTRFRQRVRWKPTVEGFWAFAVMVREWRRLEPERRPQKLRDWFSRAMAEAGPEGIERIYLAYLDDQTIQAKGHPMAVFIGNVWEARKPSGEAMHA